MKDDIVVVAVDGSPESDSAVEWAAHESVRRDALLRIIHVWHSPPFPTDPFLDVPSSQDAFVTSAAKAAHEANPAVRTETATQAGLPSVTLIRMSEGASLIVIGGHHRNLLDRMVFGSVTTHLLSHAPCPVVVVRAPHGMLDPLAPTGPVVVGVDHDDTSDDALEFAFRYASTYGLDLVAVQAWTAYELSVSGTDTFTTIREVQDALSAGMRLYQSKHPGVSVVTIAACETPVDALLDWAGKASLLVVGSRGRGSFAGMFLGSVSAAIAHQAPCSVAVVRPRSVSQLLQELAS